MKCNSITIPNTSFGMAKLKNKVIVSVTNAPKEPTIIRGKIKRGLIALPKRGHGSEHMSYAEYLLSKSHDHYYPLSEISNIRNRAIFLNDEKYSRYNTEPRKNRLIIIDSENENPEYKIKQKSKKIKKDKDIKEK